MDIKSILGATVASLVALSFNASAGLIFQADSAVTSAAPGAPGVFGYIDEVINQAGLANNYVSGSTDFENFVASTPHNAGIGVIDTFGNFAAPFPMTFDFSFNVALNLDRMAIWNQMGSASLTTFELLASSSGNFDDLVSLGNFSVSQSYAGQVVNFAATDMLGLRMYVTTNAGYTESLIFTEVAFGAVGPTTTVPVPPAVWLFGSGLIGLIGAARRKKA